MTNKQKNELKKVKREGIFNRGRAGCESRLFEFRGLFGDGVPPEGEELEVRRVAANDLHEALAYMKRWEENFDIRGVQLVGIIVMLSGSPLH